MRLFVSYSHEDRRFVENLAVRLSRAHHIWYDDRLHAGTDWWNKILQKLDWCDCFIYVLSLESLGSRWCQEECAEALRLDKQIVPLRLQPTVTLPNTLGKVQYADFAERSFEDALIDLLSDLSVLERRLRAAPQRPLVSGRPVAAPTAGLDENALFELMVESRRANDHETALRLGNTLLSDAPDFLPYDVTRLKLDSEQKLEEIARRKEYDRRYRQIGLLRRDPLTLDSARKKWGELQDDYPEIDIDPDGHAGFLFSPTYRITEAVRAVLPEPFEWCTIPGGRVALEGDAGTFNVSPFLMAKYLITFEQFQVFIEAQDGFQNSEWWQGLAADENHRQQPGKQRFTYAANLPRECVSWFDAIAFCRWLSEQTSLDIRLPTEWQWQHAAQGENGNRYPWGEAYIQGCANICEDVDEAYGGEFRARTSPVGSYPEGVSPYGILDMIGNVWEWCLNEYDRPTGTDLTEVDVPALRGGSWGDDERKASAVTRDRLQASARSYFTGFRVTCRPAMHWSVVP